MHEIWNVASQMTGGLKSPMQMRCISVFPTSSSYLRLGQSPQSAVHRTIQPHTTNFSTLCSQPAQTTCNTRLLENFGSCKYLTPCRTNVRFSYNKGKPKSVKSITERFLRLHWGIWIRPRAGRQKKLWKKSMERKRRLRYHVFCNRQQSRLFDKMVTKCWKEPKYYVDSPYEGYQKRTNMQKYYPERPPFLP
ncbi:39S ribosomal protein L35, mitochondrial-like isoform X2 [Gigantopelta aegis]|uniref:39S ribosomal protein L35, mitochondrial-like isoform X2 n=1 Tax=Gigantopelta aegis TaxID=1735272 RepID=UPI001B888017|nr:39S ribosomal protein L35, mitochondrial-like isoform X2 [Gigantopelta aegis]